jgi:capsular polysaccharide biosynthesis protein
VVEEQKIELIDYLNVVWKRKALIIGGTLLAAATALVVSLSMPKTYEVSRTLKIGRLPGSVSDGRIIEGKLIETRDELIARLNDHRLLKRAVEKIHLGLASEGMNSLLLIGRKTNPDVRYTVQANDPQVGGRIADQVAEYIIAIHRPIFERGLQLAKEYEAELAMNIRTLETENRNLKRILEKKMERPDVDPTAVVLLEANIGERERNLATRRRQLKLAHLSRLGSGNTSVIAADIPPQHPVKPRVKLNVVLAGTLGLMGFTFLAFFLEYLANVKKSERVNR